MTDTAQAQSTEAKLEENEIVPDGSVSPANVPADIPVPGEKIPDDVMKDLVALVWGPAGPDRENLHRWSQGFAFSSGEPTALVQLHGGPCAVIAPVQAYLLKNAIFSDGTHPDQNWRAGKNVNLLLATTFTELFSLLSASTFTVVLAGETLRIPAKRDATAMDLEAIVVDDSPDSPNEHGIHAKLRQVWVTSQNASSAKIHKGNEE